MLASPLQMARFYALLANGGKLVTPHLVSAIEQPGPRNGRRRARRCSAATRRRRGAQPRSGRDHGDPRRALRGDALGLGTSANTFGHYPVAIAGKTGTAETHAESGCVRRPRRTRRGGAVSASLDAPRLVVCAVIENGGFGGAVAAPSALPGVRAVLREEGHQRELGADGLMVDYAADQTTRGPPTRPRARETRTLRNSTGCSWPRSEGSSRTACGSISGITKDDIPGNPTTTSSRQAAYALVGCAGPGRDDAHRASASGASTRGIVYGVLIAMLVPDAGARLQRPQHAALDRLRAVPLPAVRVREALARPVPGRVPRGSGQADLRAADDAWRRSASRRCR